jgi:hypothetical protein
MTSIQSEFVVGSTGAEIVDLGKAIDGLIKLIDILAEYKLSKLVCSKKNYFST